MQSLKPIEIYKSPKITILKNFIDENASNEIINTYSSANKPSYVTDGITITKSKFRSSSSSLIKKENKKILKLRTKICSLFDWSLNDCERFQFITYNEGEEYAPHFDAFDTNQIKSSRGKIKNQRLITNIIYLNENFTGGETLFPKLDVSIKAETGMILSFENCISDTNFLNPFSIHQSNPISEGKKHILISWLLKKVENT